VLRPLLVAICGREPHQNDAKRCSLLLENELTNTFVLRQEYPPPGQGSLQEDWIGSLPREFCRVSHVMTSRAQFIDHLCVNALVCQPPQAVTRLRIPSYTDLQIYAPL
jgi:hypothetical protein